MLQCLYTIGWSLFLMINVIPVLVLKECFLYCFVITNGISTHGNFDSDSTDLPTNASDAMIFLNKSSANKNDRTLLNLSEHWDIDTSTDNERINSYSKDIVSLSQGVETNRYFGEIKSKHINQSKEYHNILLSKEGSNRSSPIDKFDIEENDTKLSLSPMNIKDDCLHVNESNTHNNCSKSGRIPLYIGGLFDLSGGREESLGQSELTAAKLAIHHVNKLCLLPQYELVLLHNDSKCDPGVGMDALYNLIYRQPQIVMMIGSACSEVTKTLSEIVPYWNLILVSYASTSPALSEREKYKTFFRLAPADSSQNVPRALFINEFGWDTVATLFEMERDYSLAVDEMGKTFEQNNITIKISTSFRRYDDIAANLIAIKRHDARIIIGGYTEKAARHVLCQAYRLNMFGPRYVWIIIGDYVEKWWEITNDTLCSRRQLQKAAEGYFTIDSLNSLSDDDMSSLNISFRHFVEEYDLKKGVRPMSPYATSSYDSVWTIALTLRHAIDQTQKSNGQENSHLLENFTYENGTETRNIFFDIMQDLGFLGISGPISFEGPDRKGISVISQNQNGRMVRIALYEPEEKKLNFYCRACQPIIWLGGRAPRDKTVLVSRKKKIDALAFLSVSSVSVCGLILASAFLAYNLYHRRLRYIKLSSPKLNNVAVVGCMFVYAGIIVLGYDDTMLDEVFYPYLCTTRAFLFAAGFSLSFGAMFTKTYRVHQIFTRANRGLIKSKLLRDKQLLFIIGALLVVDSVVLLIWGFVDPMHKQITNLTTEVSENDDDLLYISQLTKCHSDHLDKWTGILYVYKGLLLMFGVYMAWETRHVKIPALNDSRYIGMNVYNVVIMSALVVTISNILSHQPTLAYVMESSFMLISTTTTLCLLFVPKIYAILTYKGEPIIAASGITVEANCRRFAVDERREHFYRAEVQNRVYKREIIELEAEIIRLERLLEIPVKPYPKLTRELLKSLPESTVDPSPDIKRRWTQDRDRDVCVSISDAGDVCMGVSEDRSDDGHGQQGEDTRSRSKPFRRRANRLSIRVATNYAYTKLCKLRPRFSVGSVNFKHDYEDLKGSPTSPDGHLINALPIERSRSSHPLMRQEALELSQGGISVPKQDSEKSETKTCDTRVSDEMESEIAQECPSIKFYVPQMDLLKVPSNTDLAGCEQKTLTKVYSAPVRRRRKHGNTLSVSPMQEACLITEVDSSSAERSTPRLRRAKSILEHERRTRIRKLQADLRRIQNELQNLNDLEYDISEV